MRFIMTVKNNAKSEAGILPDEQLLSAMGRYNEELVKAGVLLGGEGLHPSAKASRVRAAATKITVVDGPFAEAKELLGGFWIIQVKSRDEAIGWAKRVPGHEGEIEIRSLYEASDFPADPDAPAEPPAAAAPPARKPGTTRFMIILKSDKQTESAEVPDPRGMAKMGALIGEFVASGAFLAGAGLKPSATGARITLSGDKRTVTDGPFAESKELIAGYSVIQTASRAEAVEFAKHWMQIHIDIVALSDGEIDVRQIFELSDFPVDAAEKPAGWREQEQGFRDRTGS
jgi:hypothetical protein